MMSFLTSASSGQLSQGPVWLRARNVAGAPSGYAHDLRAPVSALEQVAYDVTYAPTEASAAGIESRLPNDSEILRVEKHLSDAESLSAGVGASSPTSFGAFADLSQSTSQSSLDKWLGSEVSTLELCKQRIIEAAIMINALPQPERPLVEASAPQSWKDYRKRKSSLVERWRAVVSTALTGSALVAARLEAALSQPGFLLIELPKDAVSSGLIARTVTDARLSARSKVENAIKLLNDCSARSSTSSQYNAADLTTSELQAIAALEASIRKLSVAVQAAATQLSPPWCHVAVTKSGSRTGALLSPAASTVAAAMAADLDVQAKAAASAFAAKIKDITSASDSLVKKLSDLRNAVLRAMEARIAGAETELSTAESKKSNAKDAISKLSGKAGDRDVTSAAAQLSELESSLSSLDSDASTCSQLLDALPAPDHPGSAPADLDLLPPPPPEPTSESEDLRRSRAEIETWRAKAAEWDEWTARKRKLRQRLARLAGDVVDLQEWCDLQRSAAGISKHGSGDGSGTENDVSCYYQEEEALDPLHGALADGHASASNTAAARSGFGASPVRSQPSWQAGPEMSQVSASYVNTLNSQQQALQNQRQQLSSSPNVGKDQRMALLDRSPAKSPVKPLLTTAATAASTGPRTAATARSPQPVTAKVNTMVTTHDGLLVRLVARHGKCWLAISRADAISAFGGDADDQQVTWQAIEPSLPASFASTSCMRCNARGDKALVVGPAGVTIINLPDSSIQFSSHGDEDGSDAGGDVPPATAVLLSPSTFSSSLPGSAPSSAALQAVEARWHPLSDGHVLVLSVDAIRVFNANGPASAGTRTGTAFPSALEPVDELRLPLGPSLHNPLGLSSRPVSFAFGCASAGAGSAADAGGASSTSDHQASSSKPAPGQYGFTFSFSPSKQQASDDSARASAEASQSPSAAASTATSLVDAEDAAAWESLTLYILCADGAVYSLCPYLPPQSLIPRSMFQCLQRSTVASGSVEAQAWLTASFEALAADASFLRFVGTRSADAAATATAAMYRPCLTGPLPTSPSYRRSIQHSATSPACDIAILPITSGESPLIHPANSSCDVGGSDNARAMLVAFADGSVVSLACIGQATLPTFTSSSGGGGARKAAVDMPLGLVAPSPAAGSTLVVDALTLDVSARRQGDNAESAVVLPHFFPATSATASSGGDSIASNAVIVTSAASAHMVVCDWMTAVARSLWFRRHASSAATADTAVDAAVAAISAQASRVRVRTLEAQQYAAGGGIKPSSAGVGIAVSDDGSSGPRIITWALGAPPSQSSGAAALDAASHAIAGSLRSIDLPRAVHLAQPSATGADAEADDGDNSDEVALPPSSSAAAAPMSPAAFDASPPLLSGLQQPALERLVSADADYNSHGLSRAGLRLLSDAETAEYVESQRAAVQDTVHAVRALRRRAVTAIPTLQAVSSSTLSDAAAIQAEVDDVSSKAAELRKRHEACERKKLNLLARLDAVSMAFSLRETKQLSKSEEAHVASLRNVKGYLAGESRDAIINIAVSLRSLQPSMLLAANQSLASALDASIDGSQFHTVPQPGHGAAEQFEYQDGPLNSSDVFNFSAANLNNYSNLDTSTGAGLGFGRGGASAGVQSSMYTSSIDESGSAGYDQHPNEGDVSASGLLGANLMISPDLSTVQQQQALKRALSIRSRAVAARDALLRMVADVEAKAADA